MRKRFVCQLVRPDSTHPVTPFTKVANKGLTIFRLFLNIFFQKFILKLYSKIFENNLYFFSVEK
jgi:hypothetical protein